MYKFPDLETTRLTIRKLNMLDKKNMLSLYKEKDAYLYFTHQPRYFLFINLDNIFKDYVIEIKETKEFAGIVSINWINNRNKSTELGYILSEKFRGKGYINEALKEIIKYLFKEISLNRIELCIWINNKPSIKTAKRLNFHLEGHLREFGLINGEFKDFLLFSLLKKEYK